MVARKTKKLSFKTVVFMVVIAVIMLSIGMPPKQNARFEAVAEPTAGGTITVSFYAPDGVYDTDNKTWVVWAWIPGAMDGKIALPSGKSDTFFQESAPDNKAQTFTVPITSKGVNALNNGTDFGFVVTRMVKGGDAPVWAEKDISKDRLCKVTLDSGNNGNVYTIKGDGDCYDNLENAKRAFEQVLSASFKNTGTVIFETTSPVTDGAILKIMDGTTEVSSSAITITDAATKRKGQAEVTIKNFDYSVNYKLLLEGFPKEKSISKTLVMKSAEFLNKYKYSGTLGAIYTKTDTTFKVFAPIATAVSINFYYTSRPEDKALIRPLVYMEKMNPEMFEGIWTAKVDGDLNGEYYTYNVTNYDTVTESIDPYAKSAGVNGDRGMIIDFSKTNPEGWADDTQIFEKTTNEEEPIIYELHVRDFSVKSNSGMKNKGKYLAFTEENTFLVGDETIPTGISYLKDLGVNYVHLLPIYDFATVDETRMNDINYDTKFNWGYDPKNYNVLEGSYSTDPYNGEVRVNEFKQLVKSLHDNGIGVIMDVVYNHTYSIGGSSFDKMAPSYYHRTDANGVYTDGSGCNNETASEKFMVDKYIRDSIKFWASEYHLDGFRFDLMALHTIGTMNGIRSDMDAKYGENNIILYGEPWAAQQGTVPGGASSDTWAADLNNWNVRADGIGAFSNTIRDGIRGEHGNMGDAKGPFGGYVNGKLDNIQMVKSGVQGGIHDGIQQGNNFVKTRSPRQQIIYSSAHDNFTLWDQIVMTQTDRGNNNLNSPSDTIFSLNSEFNIKSNKMAASIMLMSKGTVFIHAGEEIARTKYGNHNSYNSPDAVNSINYARKKDFGDLYNYYKGLIAIRKQYDFLTDLSYESAKNDIYFLQNYTGDKKHYWIDGNDAYDVSKMLGYVVRNGDSSKREYLAVIVNPYDSDVNVYLGNTTGDWNLPGDGKWSLLANGEQASENGIPGGKGSIYKVPARGTIIATARA